MTRRASAMESLFRLGVATVLTGAWCACQSAPDTEAPAAVPEAKPAEAEAPPEPAAEQPGRQFGLHTPFEGEDIWDVRVSPSAARILIHSETEIVQLDADRREIGRVVADFEAGPEGSRGIQVLVDALDDGGWIAVRQPVFMERPRRFVLTRASAAGDVLWEVDDYTAYADTYAGEQAIQFAGVVPWNAAENGRAMVMIDRRQRVELREVTTGETLAVVGMGDVDVDASWEARTPDLAPIHGVASTGDLLAVVVDRTPIVREPIDEGDVILVDLEGREVRTLTEAPVPCEALHATADEIGCLSPTGLITWTAPFHDPPVTVPLLGMPELAQWGVAHRVGDNLWVVTEGKSDEIHLVQQAADAVRVVHTWTMSGRRLDGGRKGLVAFVGFVRDAVVIDLNDRANWP